jgi:hypothetical protein
MLGLDPGFLQLCNQQLPALVVGDIYKSIGTPKEGGFRIRIWICMNAHYFWKLDLDLDPDAHLSETLDPDSNYNQNSRAIRSSKWSRGGLWRSAE